MWESRARAEPPDDRRVVWLGTDYQQHPAASARLHRTNLELSVLTGEFSEQEIIDLYRAMRPAAPAAVALFAQTPFSELSYWARQPDAAKIDVPIGLWEFHRPRSHESHWRTGKEAVPLVADLGFPLTLNGLELDSAARFVDEGREEIEALYTERPQRDRELRLIAQRPGRGSLHVPAEPEEQPGERAELRIDSGTVQLGWIDERYGPFQAVFQAANDRGAVEATLLSSAGVGLDREWFLSALAAAMR